MLVGVKVTAIVHVPPGGRGLFATHVSDLEKSATLEPLIVMLLIVNELAVLIFVITMVFGTVVGVPTS